MSSKTTLERYHELTPEQRRDNWRKHRYGLSPEDFVAILAGQRGRCGACETDDPGKRKDGTAAWCIDHDHKTGRIRGVLCHRCNITLGLVEDRAHLLFALVEYLDESKTKKLPGRARGIAVKSQIIRAFTEGFEK